MVSEAWSQESFKGRTQSRWSVCEYGYGWWIGTLGGYQACYMWGHGEFIFVVPDLRLVTVTTSPPAPGEGRRQHQQAIYDLIEQDLVPAADTDRWPGSVRDDRRQLN